MVEEEISTLGAEEVAEYYDISCTTTTKSQEEIMEELKMKYPQFTTNYEMLSQPIAENQFLLDGLIYKQDIVYMVSDGGIGKSTLIKEMCYSIVTGNDFLGMKVGSQHKRVLYFNLEESTLSQQRKLKKRFADNQDDIDKVHENILIYPINTDAADFYEEISKVYNFDLVVIDVFSEVFSGDENSSNSVRDGINDFANIAKKYGHTLMLVGHFTKSSNGKNMCINEHQFKIFSHKDISGSQSNVSRSRLVISLSPCAKQTNKRYLYVMKTNDLDEEQKNTVYVWRLAENLNIEFETTLSLSDNKKSETESKKDVQPSQRQLQRKELENKKQEKENLYKAMKERYAEFNDSSLEKPQRDEIIKSFLTEFNTSEYHIKKALGI